jgi:hypothetical protein
VVGGGSDKSIITFFGEFMDTLDVMATAINAMCEFYINSPSKLGKLCSQRRGRTPLAGSSTPTDVASLDTKAGAAVSSITQTLKKY